MELDSANSSFAVDSAENGVDSAESGVDSAISSFGADSATKFPPLCVKLTSKNASKNPNEESPSYPTNFNLPSEADSQNQILRFQVLEQILRQIYKNLIFYCLQSQIF